MHWHYYFELRDPSKNHKKFWAVSNIKTLRSEGWSVTCRWGRIGTTGQERSFFFLSYGEADIFRRQKIHEKKDKGYVLRCKWGPSELDVPHTVSEPSTEAAMLSSDNLVIKRAHIASMSPEELFTLPFDEEKT